MNVLFISNVLPSPEQPGAGVFNAELIRAMRTRGHEVHSIVPVAWRTRIRAMKSGAAPDVGASYPTFWYPPGCFRASYHRWMWWSIRRTVHRVTESFRVDAVVAFWVHPDGTCAVRVARQLGVPSVVIAGGSDLLVVTANRRRAASVGRTLADAGSVLAEGAHLVARALALGAPADRTFRFRRGVDTARFAAGDASEARARLGLAPGRPLLLWAGHMVEVKGVDRLIDAHAALVLPRPLLALAGDGPLRSSLKRRAAHAGTSSDVVFPGRLSHDVLADWMRAADAFALPSLSEGTPNVLQEATAVGIPWIASDVGAVASLATEHDRVVPPDDVPRLAGAIAEVLAQPGPRHGKVAAAVSWDEAVDQVERAIAAARAAR